VGATWTEAPFTPSLYVYYDYDEGDDFYAELALAKDFTVRPDLILNGGLTIGYNGGQYQTDSGISNVVLSLGTTFAAGDRWTLTPSVQYIFTDHHGAAPVNAENELVVGLALATAL